MLINRILNRENLGRGCFILGTSSFLYSIGSDTFGQKFYIRYIQKYKYDGPAPVHNILKFRLQEVFKDLNVSSYDQEFYDLFIVDKLDPVLVGAKSGKQGVKIGIPEYFQAATDYGIKNSSSTMFDTPIDWSSETGEQLLQSLCLSEAAQKFILAKAVFMTDNYYYIFKAILTPFLIYGYHSFTFVVLSWKVLLPYSGLPLTLATYILGAILYAALYQFCKEVLYLQYDKISEEKVWDISQTYILAGLEYYKKKVERNIALRNLVKNGHKYYDENGNENLFWRPTGIPPSIKIKLTEERLGKYEFDKEAMTPPPVNPNPYPIL